MASDKTWTVYGDVDVVAGNATVGVQEVRDCDTLFYQTSQQRISPRSGQYT